MHALTPKMDDAPGVPAADSDDPYTRANRIFGSCQQHVRNGDLIIADLNDFHGYEPNKDVSFECGMT